MLHCKTVLPDILEFKVILLQIALAVKVTVKPLITTSSPATGILGLHVAGEFQFPLEIALTVIENKFVVNTKDTTKVSKVCLMLSVFVDIYYGNILNMVTYLLKKIKY